MVGDAVKVSRLVTGGRNSRIWHVASGQRAFALKQYPSRQDDPRDRLTTEVGALQLMERYRIDTVPRVTAVDGEHGYALLSWIDGIDVDRSERCRYRRSDRFPYRYSWPALDAVGGRTAAGGRGLSVRPRDRAADSVALGALARCCPRRA